MIAYRQLIALGLEDRDIQYRVRIGKLHQVFRGAYAVGHRKLTWPGRFMAAVLAVEGSVLSHISAAILYGMLRPQDGDIHVTVANPRPSRKGIRVHTSPSVRATPFDEVPVTRPARTLLDLCSMRSVPDRWCLRAMNQALVDELTTIDELFEEAQTKRPGAKRMKRLLWSAAPARSPLEDETITQLRQAGLPPFEVNYRLHTHEVDIYIPGLNLVIEIDSARYHDNPFAQAYDRWKTKDLGARGKRIVRVRSAQEAITAAISAAGTAAPALETR